MESARLEENTANIHMSYRYVQKALQKSNKMTKLNLNLKSDA
jgi:hypothetical protein